MYIHLPPLLYCTTSKSPAPPPPPLVTHLYLFLHHQLCYSLFVVYSPLMNLLMHYLFIFSLFPSTPPPPPPHTHTHTCTHSRVTTMFISYNILNYEALNPCFYSHLHYKDAIFLNMRSYTIRR